MPDIAYYALLGGLELGLLVLHWRALSLCGRQNLRLFKQHADILEHLCVAANPNAWVAQQNEKWREERKDAVDTTANEETPRGVF